VASPFASIKNKLIFAAAWFAWTLMSFKILRDWGYTWQILPPKKRKIPVHIHYLRSQKWFVHGRHPVCAYADISNRYTLFELPE
jgi:hypothetical protein